METSSAKRRKLSPGEGASAGSDGGRDSTPLQPQARSELQVKLPFDPFARRGLRRSPQSADATARSSGGRGVGISPRPRQRKPLADFVIRRDPEQTHHLPPTPIQLGIEDPVVTNIPKGLSNSPTKKLRRRFYERAFAPPPLPRQLSRDSSANADKENVDPQEAYLSTEDLLLQKAAAAEAENEEKTRRDLEAELEQLRKDVRLLEDELEAPDSYTDDQLASCPDLLAALLAATSHQTEVYPPPPAPPSLSSIVNSFLPFHPRRPQPNPVQAQKLLDEIQLPDIRPKPTPQTSQLFSSLHSHLGSTLTRDPSATNPTQLLHTHTITLTAQAQLFRAIITFAVPSPTTTVSALQLKRLSPWARPELQPFLEREVATQDVNLLCWACGRYFDTALERAQVWSQLAAEAVACGSFVLGGRSSVTSPSKLEGDGAGSIRRVDVMPYLGKRRLQLQFGAPYVAAGKQQRCVVVFGWDIGLDRCGDPRPEYRMSVRFPDQVYQHGLNETFRSMPVIFEAMRRERGFYLAGRAMIKLFSGCQGKRSVI